MIDRLTLARAIFDALRQDEQTFNFNIEGLVISFDGDIACADLADSILSRLAQTNPQGWSE